MSFEMFINFMMSYIRLEPNLWIKSSEVHQTIVKKLRDQFGDSLGDPIQNPSLVSNTAANGNPSNGPMDVN
jgi:hypothetical protein